MKRKNYILVKGTKLNITFSEHVKGWEDFQAALEGPGIVHQRLICGTPLAFGFPENHRKLQGPVRRVLAQVMREDGVNILGETTAEILMEQGREPYDLCLELERKYGPTRSLYYSDAMGVDYTPNPIDPALALYVYLRGRGRIIYADGEKNGINE